MDLQELAERLDRAERAIVRADALRLRVAGVTDGYLSTRCPQCQRMRLELDPDEQDEAVCEKCGWRSSEAA
jgi:hypothetical protein